MPDESRVWSAFKEQIVPLLDEEDDPELWAAAVDSIYSDAAAVFPRYGALLCNAAYKAPLREVRQDPRRDLSFLARVVPVLGECSN